MALVQYSGGGGGLKSAPKNNKVQYKAPKPYTDQQKWAQLMNRMDRDAGRNKETNAYGDRYNKMAEQYGYGGNQKNNSANSQGGQGPSFPYSASNPTGYKNYNQMSYRPPNDYREKYSNILMTLNEYMRRRESRIKDHPGLFATDQEWQVRNNAAPAGYMWTPFGTGYAALNTGTQPTNTQPGGGDYGGSYAGGGGGGGYSYTPQPPEWWLNMVNWRI